MKRSALTMISLALLCALASPSGSDTREEKLQSLVEKLEALQSELSTLREPDSPSPHEEEAAPAADAFSSSSLEVVAYANGDRYVGEVKEGSPNGIGTFHSASGRELRGNFRMGQPHGRITASLADGTFVTGHYQEGAFQGAVTLETAEGVRYEGFRLRGGNTRLVIVYPDGRRYRGDVSADAKHIVPHGHGRMVWPDGRVQDGRFDRGAFTP